LFVEALAAASAYFLFGGRRGDHRYNSSERKSARELRQGGSNYRCCIPALAGFVSPQSIAPDGAKTLLEPERGAIRFF